MELNGRYHTTTTTIEMENVEKKTPFYYNTNSAPTSRGVVDDERRTTISSPAFQTMKTSSSSWTKYSLAMGYILSGCCQPLLMTLCRMAGLANSSSQLYMLFYYLGPALVIIPLLMVTPVGSNGKRQRKITTTKVPWIESTTVDEEEEEDNNGDEIDKDGTGTSFFVDQQEWPSSRTILRGCGIAVFDICSQTMNYTGASLAGPTIFAVVYSSVTIWTALGSRFLLGRTMNLWQWSSVVIVFGGLTLAATDSAQVGGDVWHGLLLVGMGSILHALTYVFLEAIMTVGEERLSVPQNCAIHGVVAASCFLVWQLVYTLPRWDETIGHPMREAGTTISTATGILLLFAGMNLLHALTFFYTLRHMEGGATSAGVMKGLQAVLVFIATHILCCGRTGGEEMCFTRGKFLSLITVAGGVTLYGFATSIRENDGSLGGKGYGRIPGHTADDVAVLPKNQKNGNEF